MPGDKSCSGVNRPTRTSAMRASIEDEEKRREKAKEKNPDKLRIDKSVAAYSITRGQKRVSSVNRPTVTSAMRALIVDEEKRKEKAKVNKIDKLGMGKSVAGYKSGMDKSVAAYSSARGQERVSITTISDNRVVSKTPISASVPKSVTSMTKTSVGYSSSVFEKKFARSLSIDDGNSSSFQIARTTVGIDETFSPSNGKLTRLTRSVSNEESSSLQKTLDVSASVHVKLPQDTSQTQYDTRSSYAKTFSTRQTSASRSAALRDDLDLLGKTGSKPAPTGQYVDEMLKWKGDYEILERNHSPPPTVTATDGRIHTTREEMGPRDIGPEEGATGGRFHTTMEDDEEDDNTRKVLPRFKGIQMDDHLPCDNWKFYTNQIHSRPSPGYTIEAILQHQGDYFFLDFYPYFIQWLFPTPTMCRINEEAQPLYTHEADAIMNDELAFKRVIRAYVLVLDYYGLKLLDGVSGELKTSKRWKSRWKDLNAGDNREFMRITRILKSLGELGYERYQVPLIQMFIIKGLQTDKYIKGLTWMHVSHWINCIKDEGEKQAMFEQYKHMMFRSSRSDGQVRRDDRVQHQHTDVNPSYWTDTDQYMM